MSTGLIFNSFLCFLCVSVSLWFIFYYGCGLQYPASSQTGDRLYM